MKSSISAKNGPFLTGRFMAWKWIYFSFNAAWAAARRAIGTRNGEQLT